MSSALYIDKQKILRRLSDLADIYSKNNLMIEYAVVKGIIDCILDGEYDESKISY